MADDDKLLVDGNRRKYGFPELHPSEVTRLLQQPPDSKPVLSKKYGDRIAPSSSSLLLEGREKPSIVLAVIILIAAFIFFLYWDRAFSFDRDSDTGIFGGFKNSHDNTTDTNYHEFPSNFVWGSATSSYQVEGAALEDGRGKTIWDTYCERDGRVLNHDAGDVACDHYHRYKEDVGLMKSIGLKAYRFSIAWSRILPNGTIQDYGNNGDGGVNVAGIDFYNRLIDTLLENGIEPWATLYHWDLPQSLEGNVYGDGWLGRGIETSDAFAQYARICYQHFGDRVKHWITINEPWTVAVHGYNDGVKAPGKHYYDKNADGSAVDGEAYLVAHNLLIAHGKAVDIYRREFQSKQKGIIGLAANADFRYPRSDKKEDRDAAERAILFFFGWFVDPIMKGDYPPVMRKYLGARLPRFTAEQQSQIHGSSDFLGINTYSSQLASQPEHPPEYGGYWADMQVHFTNDPTWDHNFMGWNIVPSGTRELLLWITKRYDRPVIYITENGSAEDEPDHAKEILHDEKRRAFFEGNLRACAEAIEGGAQLAGYFAWSLMDNFEWEYGYQRRFGICHVDFDTQVRTPKLSALWYNETIHANGKNIHR